MMLWLFVIVFAPIGPAVLFGEFWYHDWSKGKKK